MNKKPAMGKGLAALIGNIEAEKPQKTHLDLVKTVVIEDFGRLPLEDIDPNPENPRKDFSDDELNELADSIREYDIITPITVQKNQNRYQILSGERRFRAAKIAGLKTIPAYIRITTDDVEKLGIALVENIQRKDLNPVDVANSLKALMETGNLTQEQVSQKVGKSRSLVANHLRLLKLPAEIILALRDEEISMGHAKPLVSLENDEKRIEILRRIIKENLSVRQVEELCQPSETSEETETSPKQKKVKASKATISDHLEQMHENLSKKLETPVKYRFSTAGKGQITIEFKSWGDFDRIISILS